jgi:DNA-binding MarR family transcriptional regulator
VTREKSTTDGRLVVVSLTPSGRSLMDKLFPQFNKQEQSVAAALPANQLADVAEALRLITQRAEGTN